MTAKLPAACASSVRRLGLSVALATLLLATAACGDSTEQPSGEASSQSPSTANEEDSSDRLTVHPWAAPELKPIPSELHPLASEMAELVDFHDRDFSGSWVDRDAEQVVIGVATDIGLSLLEQQGFADEPRLRIQRVRWSLAGGQDILLEYEKRSVLADRFVTWGTLPEGNGFFFEIKGNDLSEAERADLLTLPGHIEVVTGMLGGGGF